jgi:hypothetical protein
MAEILSTVVILAWNRFPSRRYDSHAWMRHLAYAYLGHPFDVPGAYTPAGFVRLL